MIPEYVSPAPVIAILAFAALVFGTAAYKAWQRLRDVPRAPQTERLHNTLRLATAVGAILALGTAGLATNIATTHDAKYRDAVWSTLEEQYDLRPMDANAPFEAGVPFAALLGNEPAECVASPPGLVACDGVTLEATFS